MRTLNLRKAACACALFAAALLAYLGLEPALAETDGMLRVNLARLGAPSVIEMRADCDYYLAEDPSMRVPAGNDIAISASGGTLFLTAGGHTAELGPAARLLRGAAGRCGISFTSPALSNRFCGDLYFAASGDVITAVLHIYVEDYLCGVVGCEMAPSSGLEALKAQAVVARNYALRQKAARSGAAYDLTDTGDALSFRGYNAAEEYADVSRAVDETRGQVLYYEDSPAACYFCDSNGGQTESSANAFDAPLPYSVVRDDPYDFDGAGVRKTAVLSRNASDLQPALADALIAGAAEQLKRLKFSGDPSDLQIAAIEDIEPTAPRFDAPSRLFKALAFRLSVVGRNARGEARTAQVTVNVPTYGALELWYDLSINDGDNETIWVNRDDRAFEIAFRRSGSGVGMSRRGAQVMARKGFRCEEILDFYYPGAALRRLELTATLLDVDVLQARAEASIAEPIATARLSQKARLYGSPDEAYGALTTLPAGATVSVYDVQGEWASIGSGELRGYTHAEALASFALVGVSAAQVKDRTMARVTAGRVDVLQLPVSTASALDTLDAGSTVQLNAYTDEWALVTTALGVEGFIPRAALTLQADDESAGDGEITVAQNDLFGLLTEDAGLYVNADDSIEPIQTLKRGSYVRILAYNRAWAYVRTQEPATGYMKLGSLSAVQQVTAQDEPGIEGGEVTVVSGVEYRVVAVDALSLFKSYSTDSPVLATLRKGDRVRLGAYNGVWACVRTGSTTGFALLSGLSEADPAAEAIEGGSVTRVKGRRFAVVVAGDSPLFPTWNASDEPIALLDEGVRVQVGAYNGVWACVRWQELTGFMRIDALEPCA